MLVFQRQNAEMWAMDHSLAVDKFILFHFIAVAPTIYKPTPDSIASDIGRTALTSLSDTLELRVSLGRILSTWASDFQFVSPGDFCYQKNDPQLLGLSP